MSKKRNARRHYHLVGYLTQNDTSGAVSVPVYWDSQTNHFYKVLRYPAGMIAANGELIKGVSVDDGQGGTILSQDLYARIGEAHSRLVMKVGLGIACFMGIFLISNRMVPRNAVFAPYPFWFGILAVAVGLFCGMWFPSRCIHAVPEDGYDVEASLREVWAASQNTADRRLFGSTPLYWVLVPATWGLSIVFAFCVPASDTATIVGGCLFFGSYLLLLIYGGICYAILKRRERKVAG